MDEAAVDLTPELIASVSSKLDAVSDQFTPEERATLLAVFGIAMQAIEGATPDVSGFAPTDVFVPRTPFPDPIGSLGTGFKGTFNPGITRAGGHEDDGVSISVRF